jgi:hypothetical protein
MTIFYLTIPLMLIAIGFAVIPLLWAMKCRVESEARVSVVGGAHGSPSSCEVMTPQLGDLEDSFTDASDVAA